VGQDVPQKNLSCVIVDFSYEPESISFNVKHREFVHGIRRREHLPDFHEITPPRFSGNPIPDIQGRAETGMLTGRFEQLLPANDVQDWPQLH
jgi:hypothetical protein